MLTWLSQAKSAQFVVLDSQEAERMNMLLGAMRRSLAELDLGLKGDLTMSEPMEKLMFSLASDQVPAGVTLLQHQQCSRTAVQQELFSMVGHFCF